MLISFQVAIKAFLEGSTTRASVSKKKKAVQPNICRKYIGTNYGSILLHSSMYRQRVLQPSSQWKILKEILLLIRVGFNNGKYSKIITFLDQATQYFAQRFLRWNTRFHYRLDTAETLATTTRTVHHLVASLAKEVFGYFAQLVTTGRNERGCEFGGGEPWRLLVSCIANTLGEQTHWPTVFFRGKFTFYYSTIRGTTSISRLKAYF
jgi:hypothetical protein